MATGSAQHRRGWRSALAGLWAGWLLLMATALPAASPVPTTMVPGRPYFRVQSIRDGLPQGTVMAIAFDTRGVMWVGTQEGAAWFDGRVWTVVDMPDRAISNYVEAVLPASDGSVWFGRQDGGIARLWKGTWSRVTRQEGLPAERVTSLAETVDAQGRPLVWAGTYGGGVARWDGEAWQVIDKAKGLPSNRIWKLVARPRPRGGDELWVAGEQGGLARLDAEGRILQTFPDLPKVSINGILETVDEAGGAELWVSLFGRGVGRLAGGTWTFFGLKEGLPSLFGTDINETRSLQGKRVIWATTVAGLARLEGGRWEVFTVRWGLPTDTVYRLRRDPYRADGMWIGSSGGGLLYFQEGSWRVHDAPSGLPGNFVLSVAKGLPMGGRATLLAGTSQGLARYRDGAWTPITLSPDIQSTRVNAIIEDVESGLWLGTLSGVSHLQGGRWTTYGVREGLPHPSVGALFLDRDGQGRSRLWVGTQGGGLAVFGGGRWEVHSTRNGFPSDTVLAILRTEEPEGPTHWVGLRGGGLARLQRDRWTVWDRSRGLPNNIVNALHVSQRPGGVRELWVGTSGGGVAWTTLEGGDPLRWEGLTTTSTPALPSDVIHQIQEDGQGRIYLATNRGVVRVTRSPGGPPELELFTEEDGLPSNQCSPTGSLRDDQGRIWFGTALGLAELDPSKSAPPEAAKPLLFKGLWVGNQAVPLAPGPGPTVLGPRVRGLSLEFGLLSYRKVSENRFRTQLEGHEAGPTPWGQEGRREFTNLPPGEYRFRIWGRDWAGRVTGPLEVPFRIRPALWETLSFRIGVILALGGALFGAVRWRLATIHRHAQQLERLVSTRTRDLAEANLQLQQEVRDRILAERVKDEFVSVVSHELRTPLTSMRGAMGLMEGGVAGELPAQAKDLVRLAHSNALRLTALVNDLLDLQKLESGTVEMRPQSLSLRELATRTLEANQGLRETYQVGFDLVEGPDAQVVADPLRTEQVLTNLLSNGAKFSPRGQCVTVRILPSDTPGRARISVTNLGPPIPEAFRSRIFGKFAQADASSSRPAGGTGLGLAISKTLIEGQGGAIGFESDAAATTFWFDLPLADRT